MTDAEKAEALSDLCWVLQRAEQGTSALAVNTLLGTKDEKEALRWYPGLSLSLSLGMGWLHGTREVWLDIAVQRLGREVVTDWLLQQEE